jgi:hypothetical protein
VITYCYELVADFMKSASKSGKYNLTPEQAVLGPFFFIVLHETAHGLFHVLAVPVLGREEDAADQVDEARDPDGQIVGRGAVLQSRRLRATRLDEPGLRATPGNSCAGSEEKGAEKKTPRCAPNSSGTSPGTLAPGPGAQRGGLPRRSVVPNRRQPFRLNAWTSTSGRGAAAQTK